MTDNVAPGGATGTAIAFDNVGGILYQRVKISVGADGEADDASLANPVPVALAAGEEHIGEFGGKIVRVSATFTRPADTTGYTANDVVSNNASTTTLMTLANAVRVAAGSGYIVRARLETDKKSITPRFRVHLYNASNPTVSADNAAMQDKYADSSKRIAQFDLPAMTTAADTTNSDMSRAHDSTLRVPIVAAAGATSIYAMLEALDAFTPASGESFTLTLWIDQN